LLDLSAAAAGRISFPASQNASAGANVLDDYEEGTFTPTWSASAGTAVSLGNGSFSGVYTKIGDLVHFQADLIFGSTTTYGDAGTYRWSGLPFTPGASVGSICNAQLLRQGVSYVNAQARINPSSTTVTDFIVSTGANYWANTYPYTWANTDISTFRGSYKL
jgi:hypothetical protein